MRVASGFAGRRVHQHTCQHASRQAGLQNVSSHRETYRAVSATGMIIQLYFFTVSYASSRVTASLPLCGALHPSR